MERKYGDRKVWTWENEQITETMEIIGTRKLRGKAKKKKSK